MAVDPARTFVGYAPVERFTLKEYLGAQGIRTEDMVEVPLVGGDDIPVPRLPRAWRHPRHPPSELRLIQPPQNLGWKLTIVMAARAITHRIEHDR